MKKQNVLNLSLLVLRISLLLFVSGDCFGENKSAFPENTDISVNKTDSFPVEENEDSEMDAESQPIDTLLLKAYLHKAIEMREALAKELEQAAPDEIYAIYASGKYRFDYTSEFEEIGSLLGENRLWQWYSHRPKKENETYYVSIDDNIPPLKSSDLRIIELLENEGLDIDSSEGMAFLILSKTAYYAAAEPYFDKETREFAGPEASYSWIAEDAALNVSHDHLLDRCIKLERFLDKYPESRYRKEVLALYKYYMENIMFCMYDNTPTFEIDYGTGEYKKINPDVLKEIEALPGKYPDSQADTIIREYLKGLKANNYKYSKAFEKKLMNFGLLGEAGSQSIIYDFPFLIAEESEY